MKRIKKRSILSKTFYTSFIVFVLMSFTTCIGILIDGAIIGQFLGSDSVAAYGIVSPLSSMFALIGIVFSSGSRARYTKLVGQGKTHEANSVFSLSVVSSIGIAVVVMLFTIAFSTPISKMLGATGNTSNLLDSSIKYLIGVSIGLPAMNAWRAINSYMVVDSNEKLSIISTIAMTVANTVFDLITVFVIHGDMLFIGLATSLSYCIALMILLLHFKKKNRILSFTFANIDLSELRGILETGLPMGVCYVSSTAKSVLMNNMLAICATSSAVAAYSVQRSADDFLNPITIGIADTVALISGILLGEHNRPKMKRLIRISINATILFSCSIAAVAFFLAPLFASIYIDKNVEALQFSISAVKCYAIGMPLYGLNLIYINYLQSTGKSKLSSILGFLLECGVLLISALVMLPKFQQEAIWLAFPVTQVINLIICATIIFIYDKKENCKNKGLLDKILLLPNNFDIKDSDRIDESVDSVDGIMNLSKKAWDFCTEHGCDAKRRYVICLMIEEIGTNIIKHGFTSEKYSIDLRIIKDGDDYIVRIRDNCQLFDPKRKFDEYVEKNSNEHYGIMLAFAMAKDVKYMSVLKLNSLLITV